MARLGEDLTAAKGGTQKGGAAIVMAVNQRSVNEWMVSASPALRREKSVQINSSITAAANGGFQPSAGTLAFPAGIQA
jgi:hypothetical protein